MIRFTHISILFTTANTTGAAAIAAKVLPISIATTITAVAARVTTVTAIATVAALHPVHPSQVGRGARVKIAATGWHVQQHTELSDGACPRAQRP